MERLKIDKMSAGSNSRQLVDGARQAVDSAKRSDDTAKRDDAATTDPAAPTALDFAPLILATYDSRAAKPEWFAVPGRHGNWMLWWVREGRQRWQTNQGDERWLASGSVVVAHGRRRGRIHIPAGSAWSAVSFDPIRRPVVPHHRHGWIAAPGHHQHQPTPQAWFGNDPAEPLGGRLAEQAQILLAEISRRWWRGDHDALVATGLLAAWVARLADACRNPERNRSDPVAQAEAYAREGFARGCTVADLATLVGLSRPALSAQFQAVHGCSIGSWLRRLRLERAHELLITTALDVAVVAKRSGYADATALGRACRQAWGITPGALRAGRLPRLSDAPGPDAKPAGSDQCDV